MWPGQVRRSVRLLEPGPPLLALEALLDAAAVALHGAVDVQVVDRRAMPAGAALERRAHLRPKQPVLPGRHRPARHVELPLASLTSPLLERRHHTTAATKRKLPDRRRCDHRVGA